MPRTEVVDYNPFIEDAPSIRKGAEPYTEGVRDTPISYPISTEAVDYDPFKGVPRETSELSGYEVDRTGSVFGEEAAERSFSAWGDAMKVFNEPEKTADKAAQSLIDAEVLGISPPMAFDLGSSIDELIAKHQGSATRRGTLMEQVKQSWDIGKSTVARGKLASDFVLTGDFASIKRAQAIKLPSAEEIYKSDSLVVEAFSSAAELLPMTLEAAKDGSYAGITLGAGFGTAALFTGQPELVPPAVIAGLKVGMTAYGLKTIWEIEAGNTVLELLEMKDEEGNELHPNIVRGAAFGYGTLSTAMEASGIKLLLKTIPGAKGLFKEAATKAIMSKTVKKKLFDLGVLYAGTVGKETGIELAQESTNIVFEEMAKVLNNLTEGTEFDKTEVRDVMNRLKATARKSALGFSVIVAPGVVVQAGGVVADARTKAETVEAVTESLIVNEDMPEAEAKVEAVKRVEAVEKAPQVIEEPVAEVTPEDEAATEAALDLIVEGATLETLTDETIGAKIQPVEEVTPEVAEEIKGTPEFKTWFGESKVIDAQGEPLVVYHGTQEEFTSFDLMKAGSQTDSGVWGEGFYFSSSIEYASTYAKDKGSVMRVYLSLRNPLVINSKKDIPDISVPEETMEDLQVADKVYSKKFTEYAKAHGYDGVISNIGTDSEFVVFDPAQIKPVQELAEEAEPKRLITDETYQAAKARVDEKLKGLKTGVDPTVIPDLAIMGAYHIETGLKTFSAWSKKMVDEQGDKIKPQLKVIWKESNAYLKAQVPAKEVKGVVRKATGIVKVSKMIREDKALAASWKKAEQAARTAFREGKKEALAMERARMKDIIDKARGRIKETASVNKLKKSILKEIRTAKVKKVGGKPRGKFTADVQAVLDKFNQAIKLTETQAVEKIADNLEKYEGKTMPSEIATENKILFMSYKLQQTDKGTDKAISAPMRERFSEPELSKVLQEIKDLKNEGRMLSFLGKLDKSEQHKDAVSATLDVITGGKGLPAGLETVGIEKIKISPKEFGAWVKQFASNLGVHFVGWNDLMDMLSGKDPSEPGKSRLSELAEVHGAETAEKAGRRTATQQIADIAKESFGFETDRAMLTQFNLDAKEIEIGTFVTAVGDSVDLVMTKAEARKFMMEYADPSLRETFSLGMKYTDDMVKAINNTLTAQDKAFMGQQMNFYRDYYNRVNEVYRDIYGVDLPFNEFYTPIQREGVSVTEGIYGEFLDEIKYRREVAASSLKDRVKNISRIAKRSDVNVLERHIADMEHFIAWSERISDLNAIFKNQDVRTAIKLHHGQTMLGVIDKFINDFTRGGIETSSRLKWLDKLRGNFTRSVLAVKPTITIKQLTSVVAYAEKMPVKDFVKGTASFWAHPVENFRFLKENSVWFAERAGNMERDIKTAMRMREYSAYREKRGFIDSLMLNVTIGDQGAIAIGGFAYYKHLRKKGVSHKKAILEFEKFSEMTQQSSDLSIQSDIQRWGSFAKLFSMFLSAPNLYLRKEMGAIRNLMAGRGKKSDHIKAIAIYHLILPMFFQWVSDGFDWDEDEQLRAVITGPLNGIFLIGDGIEHIVRKSLGLRTYDKQVAMYSGVDDLSKFISEAIDRASGDEMKDEDFYRAIRGLAGGVGAFTGIPLKQAVDQLKTGENFVDGEYEKALKGVLGYSPYLLDKDKKDDEVFRVE